MKATIFDIQRNSFVDGPGVRTTVFFKGCIARRANTTSPNANIFFIWYYTTLKKYYSDKVNAQRNP